MYSSCCVGGLHNHNDVIMMSNDVKMTFSDVSKAMSDIRWCKLNIAWSMNTTHLSMVHSPQSYVALWVCVCVYIYVCVCVCVCVFLCDLSIANTCSTFTNWSIVYLWSWQAAAAQWVALRKDFVILQLYWWLFSSTKHCGWNMV